MIAFLCLLAVLFVIVAGVELLSRSVRLPLELTRKITHILVGVTVALAPHLVPFTYVIVLAGMFVVVIGLSRRLGIFRSIHDPARTGLGDLWYPIGILAAALVFHDTPAFMYGVLVLAVCDGLAGLFGKLFGKTRIKGLWEPKTYLGSLVFLASAFAISVFFLPLPIAASAALCLTVIELLGWRGLDNIALPLAAGAFVTLLS